MSNFKFLLDISTAVQFGDGYYLVDDVIMDEDELKLYEHMKKLGINPSDRGKVDDLIYKIITCAINSFNNTTHVPCLTIFRPCKLHSRAVLQAAEKAHA